MKDSADYEDFQLLAAATKWAESGVAVPQQKVKDVNLMKYDEEEEAQPSEQEATYSLHVTQLSYEASDFDVRDLFITKGCLVTSVRLVRDNGPGSERQFKGVAFVDLQDKRSFDIGLKCHRMAHLGRRINVRPVLPREELGRIAEATKEKVSQIIDTNQAKRSDGKKKGATKKRYGSRSSHGTEEKRKLSKKERNRKAAILSSRKKGRKVPRK